MGNTTTTKYQIRLKVQGYGFPPMSWNCQRDGRPSDKAIRKFVESFEASTQPGGVNHHLGITVIDKAFIMLNDGSRKVVCEYKRAPFSGILFETITHHNI